jgi:LysR family glycine cleavage system transcriptional activator
MIDWSTLPPLSALRAFAAYAEAGNLTAAGDRLNVTHAAISQQIRSLEERLGLQLLDRNGRRATLSPEGTQLAQGLQQGFGAMVRVVEDLTGADALRPVQVTLTPSFAAAWLMPRLAGLHAAHPEINLMIDASCDLRALGPGGIDLAIRYGAGDWPGVEAELLLPSPVAIVAAPSLVGAGEFNCREDLARFHWLQEMGKNETSDWFARYGVKGGVAGGITALPGNLVLEAARTGQGVAILAQAFVEEDIAAGRLRLLYQDDHDKGYYIVTRPGVQRDAVRTLLRWLRRQRAASDTGLES